MPLSRPRQRAAGEDADADHLDADRTGRIGSSLAADGLSIL
jgi:hypothetical protein